MKRTQRERARVFVIRCDGTHYTYASADVERRDLVWVARKWATEFRTREDAKRAVRHFRIGRVAWVEEVPSLFTTVAPEAGGGA